MAAPRAGVLTVGDELLFGTTVDTNGAWLSARLADLGLPVRARAVVGDQEGEIRRAIRWLLESVDVVLVTGGLGPTPDDLTRESVAAELGIDLLESAELLRGLVERFRAYGFSELPPDNARQALEPAAGQGRSLPNPLGSAPGLWFEGPGPVICFPGVPREMRRIFTDTVAPALRDRFNGRFDVPHHRFLHTTGLAESVLSARVAEALPDGSGPVGIAFLPHLGSVDVRLTVMGLPDSDAEEWLTRTEDQIRPVLGSHRFLAESGDLVEAVQRRLAGGGRRMAVAESCSGGRLAHRLTERAGASEVFVGGVVAYSNDAKTALLSVDPDLIRTEGAVSQPVVEAMARGACRAFGTTVGVAITGIAGPDGGTPDKPVGTVWLAAVVEGTVRSVQRRFPGDRDGVRERASEAALGLLHSMLDEPSSSPGP